MATTDQVKRHERARSRSGVTLVLAVIGDGSLYGASRDPAAYQPRYWMSLRVDHEPYVLLEARGVPEDVARKLEAQGLSGEQWYDDGYVAMRAARPYVSKANAKDPLYVSHAYDPKTGLVWNPEDRGEDEDDNRSTGSAPRKGARVYVESRHHDAHSGLSQVTDRHYGTVVTGEVSQRLWEGIGRQQPGQAWSYHQKEPYLLVRFDDDGEKRWEPVADLRTDRPGDRANRAGSTGVEYLTTPIVETRRTETPRYGLTREGYSKRSGAPTSLLVRLEGEKIFRRVMVWQFSNAGTAFVRVHGRPLVIPGGAFPAGA